MTQKCKLCGRERGLDDTCAKGGRCEYETSESRIFPAVSAPTKLLYSEPNGIITTDDYGYGHDPEPSPHAPRIRHYNPMCRKMWLPLGLSGGNLKNAFFHAQPCVPFKAIGLMLWDLPPDAVVNSFTICNVEVVLAGSGPLAAQIFARAGSYEQMKKLVEESDEKIYEWFDAPAMSPANRATLQLSSALGDFSKTQAALWGLGIVDGG